MNKLNAQDALARRNWISAGMLAIALVLDACASKKDRVIPDTGPTMLEIYRKHMAGLGHSSTQPLWEQRHTPGERGTSPYTRAALSEIQTRFERLPNPDLVMYVFPHLAGGGRYPVPGYSTVFSLYEDVEYALPGEVSSTQPSALAESVAAPASKPAAISGARPPTALSHRR